MWLAEIGARVHGVGRMRVLFVSTPIGTLGSGRGGGVELTLANAGRALAARGHEVVVVAPAGSVAPGFELVGVAGEAPAPAQASARGAAVEVGVGSLVANLFEAARARQGDVDVILNFAYDWLGFYLTPFFSAPVAHLVSMGSLLDVVDEAIGDVVARHPGHVACHTRAQSATFPFGAAMEVVGNGLDLTRYTFNERPEPVLSWVGRISPEKGIEDALAAADQAGRPLRVYGLVEDEGYWAAAQAAHPRTAVDYRGFLPTAQLQEELGRSQALLVTPKWEEAFGNVVAEALACGVPVVAYDRGGPAEIVRDGETGYLVEPDSVPGLASALGAVHRLDRRACRRQAVAELSLDAFGDRLERWLAPLRRS